MGNPNPSSVFENLKVGFLDQRTLCQKVWPNGIEGGETESVTSFSKFRNEVFLSQVRVISQRMIYVSEEHADCTVHEKKSIKLNPMIKNKLSIVFGGAMSNAYENSFFATVQGCQKYFARGVTVVSNIANNEFYIK